MNIPTRKSNQKIQVWVSLDTKDRLYQIKSHEPRKSLQSILDEAIKDKCENIFERKKRNEKFFPRF